MAGTESVAISGHFAYAPAYWSGQLNVFDVSDPTGNPTLVASTLPQTSMMGATNITIAGNFAFVTAKNQNGPCLPGPIPTCNSGSNDDGNGNSLTVVDISNPLAPSVVGSVHDPNHLFGAYSVAVGGHYAFIASQGLLSGEPTSPSTSTGSFSVIDLNNLAAGVIASVDNSTLTGPETNGLEHATSVALTTVNGTPYAIVSGYYGRALVAIDISNPTSPQVVNVTSDSTKLDFDNDVVVSGTHALVVNQVTSGPMFAVADLSGLPSTMSIIATISDPRLAGAYRIRLRGSVAYVAANNAAAVDAVSIANPASPSILGSVTDLTNLRHVTMVVPDSSGQFLVTVAPRQGTQTPATYPPFPLSGGPTTTSTLAMIGISATITPGSKPPNPSTSPSADFMFSSNDAGATFTCSLDGGTPTPCTSAAGADYTGLRAGIHRFVVQASDSLGLSASDTDVWSVNPPPANTGPPAIAGPARFGTTLHARTGSWTGSPGLSLQWERCTGTGGRCTAIAHATNAAYKVTAADVGATLRIVVTAANAAGATTATSPATSVIGWASGTIGTGTLNVSKTLGDSLTFTVPSPGAVRLTKLVVGLPKGSSFTSNKVHLAAGITVKSLAGKKVKFTVSLAHGRLTLTLKSPQTGVRVTTARRVVLVSPGPAAKIAAHRAKTFQGTLTLAYAGKPQRRGTWKITAV
jgi:hypothetical protein